MDSAVIPLKKHGLSLVQTVDFFYPLVDDPFTMGKIALANVVSDVYAVGVTNIDKITLIISTPIDFTDEQCNIIIPLMIKGFKESAKQAGCEINIGGIAVNPWCMIGGVATSICISDEIIMPSNALPNDVLVLTKPLGTQLATNSYIWMIENTENWNKIKDVISKNDIETSYLMAIESMCRLNLIAAKLMHKHKAHCATDVTGFGLYGHAKNLVEFQTNNVSFEIDTLPIIKNCRFIAEKLHQRKLLQGTAVETSGGLLIAMPEIESDAFCNNYRNETGHSAWIIGKVKNSGNRTVELISNPKFIDVDE